MTTDEQERPLRFMWQGQAHPVEYIAGQWRVDTGWWRGHDGGRVWRVYYKLTTDTGLLVVLFQDLTNGCWYVQRLYD